MSWYEARVDHDSLNSPAVFLGTTYKAVVHVDLTNFLEKSQKYLAFLIERVAENRMENFKSMPANLVHVQLVYDNSSPHPPEEFISENSDTAIESFSPFPIPVEDSDSSMEEIDLSFTPDDPMLSGIEEDDYDSKRDILILEELLSNYSLLLPENESFHFDIPSSSRPPAKPSVDYEETFSPVVDIRAIRILIAIAAYYDYEIWQMDVKTAFLNGHLFEEVYMEQPKGFMNPKYPNHQASRHWNKRFDDEIKKFGFTQNRDKPFVYQKASESYVTILILYVDDILLMGNNIPMLQDVKSYLGRSFAMKHLGDAAYILRIKIYRDLSKRLIGLCQSEYIEKILKSYYMENSKRGTILMQEKLKLSKSQGNMERELRVFCYTDAGYLTNSDDLKSQTGYVFILNGGVLNGGVVNWKSTKQSIFATSFTNAEYIVVLMHLRSLYGFVNLFLGLRDSYGNGDYNEESYDDDMYEGQDLPQEIQALSDNLDIRV
nr:retrotransposon protein, putative, Ty1-copia subclass [Tanacetum cinerariifolium]